MLPFIYNNKNKCLLYTQYSAFVHVPFKFNKSTMSCNASSCKEEDKHFKIKKKNTLKYQKQINFIYYFILVIVSKYVNIAPSSLYTTVI